MAAFAVFQNANVTSGFAANGAYQQGISDSDAGTVLEQGVKVPWCTSSAGSYAYYDCWLEMELDSGIVVHRQLPQTYTNADSLGSMDMFDAGLEQNTTQGVNTKSVGDFQDVAQRMAHSVYRFNLRGLALRVGYQVPIPSLKSFGGVDAIPDDEPRQRAYNKIVGNYSGVPLWKAEWSLWYTVAEPPTDQQNPPPNLAQHIRATDPLPTALQAPFSQPDDSATQGGR
jgi:hypothetical protein